MSMHPELDVIRYLKRELVNIIRHSDQGSHAWMRARMSEATHVSAIILIPRADREDTGAATFAAYVELQDDENGRCEAELLCTCERMPGDGAVWRVTAFEVLDAAPLRAGGPGEMPAG